jgi:hypothetical protein
VRAKEGIERGNRSRRVACLFPDRLVAATVRMKRWPLDGAWFRLLGKQHGCEQEGGDCEHAQGGAPYGVVQSRM